MSYAGRSTVIGVLPDLYHSCLACYLYSLLFCCVEFYVVVVVLPQAPDDDLRNAGAARGRRTN